MVFLHSTFMTLLISASQLRDSASTPTTVCQCALGPCTAWESLTEARWPAAQMQALGSLRDPEVCEPTFEEFHPQGTRYDDARAPIATAFFPANRCEAHRCAACHAVLLRYTEFGGYYVDHRVRRVDAALVV
jgi:hypothetical protein